MKKLIFGLFTSLLLLFTGCMESDDDYSLGDIWIGFGIVENANSYRIKLDDGNILIPVAWDNYYNSSSGASDKDKIDTGDRVFINYTVLDEELDSEGEIEAYYVKINSVEEVLMKGIIDITEAIEDSIGNDPIIVQEHWVSNNLLNLQLKYWGYNKTHFINLVKQPGILNAANQPFEFELRHNKNGDDEAVPYVGFVSFKLDSLVFAGVDSVRFKVKSTDYNGNTIIFEEVFKYSENN